MTIWSLTHFPTGHQESLDSLTSQLATEGIGLDLLFEDTSSVQGPSEWEHRTRVSYEIVSKGKIAEVNPQSALVKFTLENPSDKVVSFDYKLISGSAYIEKVKSTLAGTISFGVGEVEKELEIELKPWVNKPLVYGQISEIDDYWTGERMFFIYCNNIENALFSNGKRSETIAIAIENSFDYESAYEEASNYLFDLESFENMERVEEEPFKYINNDDEITFPIDIEGDLRTMIDMGVFTHVKLPTGHIENTNGATGIINYSVKKDDNILNEEVLILDDIEEIPFGEEREIEYLNLGRNAEGNGISKSVLFSLDYSSVTEAVYTSFDNSEQIKFYDNISPYSIGIEKPFELFSEEVSLGDRIPIVLKYSEPVYTEDIYIRINGEEYYPLEDKETISESVTFLFEIDEELYKKNGVLNIESISGAVDISGKGQEEIASSSIDFSIDDENILNDFFYCADPEVSINQGTSIQSRGTISISLKEHLALSNWLSENMSASDNLVSVVEAKVIGQEGTATYVPLYAKSEGGYITELTGEFNPPINDSGQDIPYLAEIYLKDSSDYKLVYGLIGEYTLPAIIYITSPDDLEIQYQEWPVADKISANSTASLSLVYNIKVNATWDDAEYFQWSSSNEEVATIDSTGKINLTGRAGIVNFTLTAKNPIDDIVIDLASRSITVMDLGDSFLTIPEWSKNIESIQGQDLKVHYSTNIPYKNVNYGGSEAETIFSYGLYEADYIGDDWVAGNLVYENIESIFGDRASNFLLIPSSQLTKTSEKASVTYIVKLSFKENETGQIHDAEAKIRVKPLPPKAILERQDSFYMTDDSSYFNISFDIENKNENLDVILSVKKNREEEPIYITNKLEDINKDHRISINKVDNEHVFDIYTVSLEAKNEGSQVGSTDSYRLYVYNSEMLKIQVNGEVKNEFIIKPAHDFATMDSSQIINSLWNDGKVSFSNKISQLSIYNSKNLSNIADKITWQVGKEGNLVLKYDDKVLNEDTEQIFLPGENLTLEAIDSGTSSVTATHHKTGLKTTLPIVVEEKIADKLYAFYAYPMNKCQVSYKNGKGEEKNLETDDWGRLGVYEESGIASDVTFYPIDREDVYGTTVLSNSQLIANQNSINDLDIYPRNTVRLVSARKYNINLSLYKDKDGTLFTEDVVIRGGAYVNGEYLNYTKINGKKGNEDQIVKANNGIYELAFNFSDIVPFGRLKPDTVIEYKIEVSSMENKHYPLIIEASNSEIRNPDNSSQGIFLSRNIQETKEGSIQNNVIVASQALILDGERHSFDRTLGIGKTYNEALLSIDLIFNNVKDRFYEISLDNNYGLTLPMSTTVRAKDLYPFSRTGALEASIDITYFINNGIKMTVCMGEAINLYPVIRKVDEFNVTKLSKPLILQNLFLESMEHGRNWDNDIYDISGNILNSIKSSGYYSSMAEDEDVKEILGFLSGFSAGIETIGLEITPTEDPLVYRGKIWFSLGSYDRNNPSGLFVTQGKSIDYNFLPGFSDVKAISKGDYLKKTKKAMDEAKSGSSGIHKTYGGGSYMECQVYWNIDKEKWDLRLLKSDSYIGGGVHYTRIHNTSIGGFPVTAEFKTGLTTEVGLKTIYDPIEDSTAYITELRPNGYVYAFGGAGFDLKAAAVKAGPYGQISHPQQFLWYNFEDISKNGQKIGVSGSTGLEYKLQFLFFSVRGKYELLSAGNSWTYNDFDEINSVFKSGELIRRLGGYYSPSMEERLEPLDENLSYQDRNYLNNDRKWVGGSAILSNAYPSSNPVLSEDGKIMIYIHDMDSPSLQDNAVNYSIRNSLYDNFKEGEEIDSSPYPDSDPNIAGGEDNALVVWTRSFIDVDGLSGEEANIEDIGNVLDSTEIMVGVYNPSSEDFNTQQLTDNKAPDFSPLAAASGEHRLVAWRSVMAGDREDPFYFNGRDEILYSTYSDGNWTEPSLVYDGIIDHVEDLKVAILADGRVAFLYQVKMDGGNSEIMVTLLDKKGNTIKNLRLTNNDIEDINPEIIALELPDSKEGFVLGWSTEDTIQILAMDSDGNLYPEYEQEIENTLEMSNYVDFTFAKGSKKMEDLSIVWSQADITSEEGSLYIYKDNLWGIKLTKEDDGAIGSSGKIKLLELKNQNTVDFYDVITDPDKNELHFLMMVGDHSGVDEKTDILMGNFQYKNEIFIDEPFYSCEDIIPGMDMPIAFNIQNLGIESIDNIKINIGEKTYEFKEESIRPGMSKDFLILLELPDPVLDMDYRIFAKFADSGDIVSKSDTLKLDLVDISIDKIRVTREENRERAFNILLSNKAYGKFKEGVHTVQLGLYKTADLNEAIIVESISDRESLELINNGGLSLDMVLDEGNLKEFLNEKGEIPDGVALVFFNAVVTEKGEAIEDADIGNDMNYILIRSLLEKYGSPLNIGSMLYKTDGETRVKIEAFNNSINKISKGNFTGYLRDASGKVLEKQEIYDPNIGLSSLVGIPGEESFDSSLKFTQEGATVDVVFTEVQDKSAKLSLLKVDGVRLNFHKDIYEYDIAVDDLKETFIIAEAEDPNSTITIKKDGRPLGILQPVAMSNGINRFVISVVNGEYQEEYIVNLNKLGSDDNIDPGDDKEDDTKPRDNIDKEQVDSPITLIINGIGHKLPIKTIGGKVVINLDLLGDRTYKDDEDLVIDIPDIIGAKTYTLDLPVDLMTGSGKGLIIINTSLGSISIPRNMLNSMAEDKGNRVNISIGLGDRSLFRKDVLEAIGERPLINLTMEIDGKKLNWDNYDTRIKVSIPYVLSEQEDLNSESMVIWHIDEDGNPVTISNGVYNSTSETMDYQVNHFSHYAIVYNKVSFNDVKSDSWYSKAVNFIAARDITRGTGNGEFSPNSKLSRGQFITMVMKAYGITPALNSADNFVDAGNTYYTNYLAKAKALGISKGVGNNKFEPERYISRQEMFLLLYNTLQLMDSLPEGSSDMTMEAFIDKEQIDYWASEAIGLLVGTGTISGSDNRLNPKSTTTRAEMAQVIYNLLSK